MDIVADYGAVADVEDFTAAITISSGAPKQVHVAGGSFSAGDIGKPINLYGCQTAGNALSTTITGVSSPTDITINDAATVFPSGVSLRVVCGTDNSAAFMNFNAWARAQSGLVTLNIPFNSRPYWIGGPNGASATRWVEGIKQLLVTGNGATLQGGGYDGAGNFSPGFRLGGDGVSSATSGGGTVKLSAKIANVSQGSLTVTLADPSQSSLFSVGGKVLISQLDLQGGGQPPNNQTFEFGEVQAISTPTITLTQPLQNSYLSTLPVYDPGSDFEPDHGGPGTIYPLNNFDITAEFQDLTINQDGQTICNGWSMTFRRCTMLGDCAIPSQNKYFSMIDGDCSTIDLEVDKLIESFYIENTPFHQLDFQSASVINLTIDSSAINMLDGMGVYNVIRNGSVIQDCRIGAHAYGRSLSLRISDSTINGFRPVSVNTLISNSFSMSDGVITIPNTSNAQPWAVPGGWCFWNSIETATGFIVLDLTQDATNTYVRTNMPGGYPTIPSLGEIAAMVHPCPSLSVLNTVGCEDVVSASQAPKGIPAYSWQTRTYGAQGKDGATQPTIKLWGYLKKITIDVQTEYKGVLSSLFFHLCEFDNWPIANLGSTSFTDWGPIVDAKSPGQRILTPSGWTGGQPLDTLQSFPANGWFRGDQNSGPKFSGNFSGENSSVWPVIVLTLETDQGFWRGALRIGRR